MSTAHLDALVAASQATLARIAADFSPAVFASSLAAEDMVLTDLILRAKLPHLDTMNRRRKEIADRYQQELDPDKFTHQFIPADIV